MLNGKDGSSFIIPCSVFNIQKAPIDIGAEHEKMLLPLLTVLQNCDWYITGK